MANRAAIGPGLSCMSAAICVVTIPGSPAATTDGYSQQ
jgi:hypothetical protein